jgi:hypothetical protein
MTQTQNYLKPFTVLKVKMSDCDNASVGSAGSRQSITQSKRDCPVCKKELAVQSLFKHIKTKHDAHWFESMYANEKMLNGYIEKCEPVPFMYEEKNDFDEVETKDIYGCLGCYNTFTHKGHGTTHCNKAKCKATHIKETKALIQRVIDMKKRMENRTDYSKWSREKLCTAIENEMRWYKWIKEGQYWRTLYNFYIKERESRIASEVVDKGQYDFDWVHNTPNGMWCRIPDIPNYDMSYNKEAKDLTFYLYHWMAITGSISSQYVFMRWHYSNKEDDEIYHEYDSHYHPKGQYIYPQQAEFNLRKLPTL